MNINVLICTINQGINQVHKVLSPRKSGVTYFISHQCTDDAYLNIPEFLKREDVIISNLPGKGLSRNRNNALKLADGDIGIIADDDIQYLPDSFQLVEETFVNNPDLDVACFKVLTSDTRMDYKAYPNEITRIRSARQQSISSVEIAFRVKSVRDKGLYFDERFGAGNSFFVGGEEIIFIQDCINRGLNVMFFPDYLVMHPQSSSINTLPRYSKQKIRMVSGCDARTRPYFAIFAAFGRTIKYFLEMIDRGRNPITYLVVSLHAILFVYFSSNRHTE